MKLISASGTITDVFTHRFVLETSDGKFLADIGPKTAESGILKLGVKVRIEGERKPSEIKVARIAVGDGEFVATHHGKRNDYDTTPFDINVASAMARAEGYQIVGALHPKKKHFEASATKAGRSFVIHIHHDGVHVH